MCSALRVCCVGRLAYRRQRTFTLRDVLKRKKSGYSSWGSRFCARGTVDVWAGGVSALFSSKASDHWSKRFDVIGSHYHIRDAKLLAEVGDLLHDVLHRADEQVWIG